MHIWADTAAFVNVTAVGGNFSAVGASFNYVFPALTTIGGDVSLSTSTSLNCVLPIGSASNILVSTAVLAFREVFPSKTKARGTNVEGGKEMGNKSGKEMGRRWGRRWGGLGHDKGNVKKTTVLIPPIPACQPVSPCHPVSGRVRPCQAVPGRQATDEGCRDLALVLIHLILPDLPLIPP